MDSYMLPLFILAAGAYYVSKNGIGHFGKHAQTTNVPISIAYRLHALKDAGWGHHDDNLRDANGRHTAFTPM